MRGFHRGFWRGLCCGFQADSGREFRRGFWRGFFLCIISKFFHQKETFGIHFKIHFEIHEEIHNKIHGAFSEIRGTLCRNSRDAWQKFTGRNTKIHGRFCRNSRDVLQKFTGRHSEIQKVFCVLYGNSLIFIVPLKKVTGRLEELLMQVSWNVKNCKAYACN